MNPFSDYNLRRHHEKISDCPACGKDARPLTENDVILLDYYERLTVWSLGGAGGIGESVVVGAGTRAAARGASLYGREIKLIDGFYQAEGSAFKFSKYYYEKLWQTGRPAPFLQAEEALATAKTVTPDAMPGFYRYVNDVVEMVYNPATKEVWHLAPLPGK